jgi:hypothetical protein
MQHGCTATKHLCERKPNSFGFKTLRSLNACLKDIDSCMLYFGMSSRLAGMNVSVVIVTIVFQFSFSFL